MQITFRATNIRAPVATGMTKKGSGIVTLCSHRTLSLSNPGTGRADIPRRTLKHPKPSGTWRRGIKAFQGFIPCSWFKEASSCFAFIAPTLSFSRTQRIIRSRIGVVRGLRALSLVETSAADTIELNSTTRISTAAATVAVHHGKPPVICSVSRRSCIIEEGPHP